MNIPNSILEKMVCLTCNNYLSRFPVYLKEDKSGAICGRCRVSEEDRAIRDQAYEIIAQFLVFPCQYNKNGCKDLLTPQSLEEHEMSCDYRVFDCPSKPYSKCNWQGTLTDLTNHFTEKHSGLLLTEAMFELNLVSSYKENVLLPSHNELFVIRKEVDSRMEKFVCSVQHLGPGRDSEHYNYFLRLVNADGSYTYKCREKSTSDDNVTKVTKDVINDRLHDPVSVIVHIEIIKSANKAEPKEEADEKQTNIHDIKNDPNINWDILAELECPVCFHFMLPPIYQCIGGHSICSVCKPQVTNCPLCKNQFQDTKNFALEKMALFLTYPCKFYKDGCSNSSKGSEIRKHEEICEFGPKECPLQDIVNCNWSGGGSEIIGHVEENHDALILKSDKINIPFQEDENKDVYYLIVIYGKLFKLCYKYMEQKFYWTVQLLGPKEEFRNFKFEIDVVDNSGNNLRCYLKGFCGPSTKIAESFSNARYYVMMTHEQLVSFIAAMLSFQVRIVKD